MEAGPAVQHHPSRGQALGSPDQRVRGLAHGGSPPSLRYLARLAATYGHGCTPSQLVDADDLDHLTPADRCLLTASATGHASAAPRRRAQAPALPGDQTDAELLVAADAPGWVPLIDGDEQQRVAAVLSAPSRVDAQTIEHIEEVLRHCQRLDYALGPQAALNTVLAQRDLARVLVPECPDTLRPRLLSAQSEASRQAGWLSQRVPPQTR